MASIQRSYGITYLVYGDEPESYADFVANDFLSEERADECDAEYE